MHVYTKYGIKTVKTIVVSLQIHACQ